MGLYGGLDVEGDVYCHVQPGISGEYDANMGMEEERRVNIDSCLPMGIPSKGGEASAL